jgi:hypothetical protein
VTGIQRERNLLHELQGRGEMMGGPPPFAKGDRSRFPEGLDKAVFLSCFVEGRNIAKMEVLTDPAGRMGLEKEQAQKILEAKGSLGAEAFPEGRGCGTAQ